MTSHHIRVRLGIATDRGGFGVKQELASRLHDSGYDVIHFGAMSPDSRDDDPQFVIPLVGTVSAGAVVRDAAICDTGMGPAGAWDIVQTFLPSEFSREERHLRRLAKVTALEQQGKTR